MHHHKETIATLAIASFIYSPPVPTINSHGFINNDMACPNPIMVWLLGVVVLVVVVVMVLLAVEGEPALDVLVAVVVVGMSVTPVLVPLLSLSLLVAVVGGLAWPIIIVGGTPLLAPLLLLP